jgi:Mn-containing catalase
VAPQFLVLTGGGPAVTNSQGVPWSGMYVNANGDLTVDLRSNIAAESRAKIVYEYLLQFTDDPLVQESLRFLMTREVSHAQMFTAALATIQPNFPQGVLQADPRHSHLYFNMSNGVSARGPWNEGQGPWGPGESWVYVDDPVQHVIQSKGLTADQAPQGTTMTPSQATQLDNDMSARRSAPLKAVQTSGQNQWSAYPQATPASPGSTPAPPSSANTEPVPVASNVTLDPGMDGATKA